MNMYYWLDRIIEEQAKHYGVTPAKQKVLISGAAEYQELIEQGVVDEPRRNRGEGISLPRGES